jgi:hypothetical protein
MICPAPPWNLPAPPLSGRISLRMTLLPVFSSHISTGIPTGRAAPRAIRVEESAVAAGREQDEREVPARGRAAAKIVAGA